MDCRKAWFYMSLHLDGALTEDEEIELSVHMGSCEECASELSLQKRLSGALRKIGQDEVQAPAEFCGMVMGRLQAERRTVIKRIPYAWRRTIAAAAAVLLLAGGSAGVTAGLKVAGSGKMLGFGTSTKLTIDEHGGSSAPSNEESTTGPEKPAILPPDSNSPGDMLRRETFENSQGDNDGTAPNILSAQGDVLPVSPDGKTPDSGGAVPSKDSARALLSNGMKVTSTVLKMTVEDLSVARIKAVAMSAGAGATTQVFPEQTGSKKILVLRIAVASNHASDLIAGLFTLGTLVDRQDESRDITNLYNETLVRYRDLQSRIDLTGDTAEQQKLQAQAESYKRQLTAWEDESGKRIIMLWMDSK